MVLRRRVARAALVVATALSVVPAAAVAQEATPGWVGMSLLLETVHDGRAPTLRVVVEEVQAGGPAAAAGVRRGDVLVRVNGVAAAEALERAFPFRAGAPARLLILRDGGERMVEVLPGRRPAPEPRVEVERRVLAVPDADSIVASIMRAMEATRLRMAEGRGVPAPSPAPTPLRGDAAGGRSMPAPPPAPSPQAPYSPLLPYALGQNRVAGAQLIDLRPEMRGYFGVGEGVLVVDVPERTPAALAGLRPGDVIVSAGGVAVRTVTDLRHGVGHALGHGSGQAELEVVRRGERLRILLGR